MKNKYILFVLCFILSLFLISCKGENIHIIDSDEPAVTDENENPPTTPGGTEELNPANVHTPKIVEQPPTTIEPVVVPIATEDEIVTEPFPAPITNNQITDTARSLIGIPFQDGGSSPSSGFDNSGFIYYILRESGYINCPRGIGEQSVMGNKIDSIDELRAGDLVFFSETGDKAQYGGIYVGGGIMISCRMPGEDVREFDISSNYYRNNFFTGVRVL